MTNKKSILKDKSFAFALLVIKTYKHLTTNKKEFIIAKQLLRSGTSIGANIREAQNAESKADFIHKLAISQKECDELRYVDGLMGLYVDRFSQCETKRSVTMFGSHQQSFNPSQLINTNL